ncbi:MAG: NADH-quinone oxidoreductase subunit C, partial [Candidatus Micrarchaeota archaeon]|nr:NADH-quinone oxidoreductase subunit C [Candidatus Micrarchaeota archaeon]
IQAFKASAKSRSLTEALEQGSCLFFSTTQKDLVQICQSCLSNGGVFDSAFVSLANHSKNEFDVYYLFQVAQIHRMVIITARGRSFSSLSANLNAALWDERKIQDISGLHFAGILDSRPLIFHPESGMPSAHPLGGKPVRKLKSKIYPMHGTGAEGEFEVAVGPVHAGIIEPGHFRFHVVGEKINKMETRMFYLHRGIEKAAEGRQAVDLLPLIEQISGDEAVANSVAYCQAVEQVLRLQVPKRAESIRAILMEMERIYSHLADLGGMATDVGFTLSASRFSVMREDMMRLNQAVSKSRFLHDQCAVGGVREDFDAEKIATILAALKALLDSLEPLERTTLTSSVFLDRIFQTGTVSKGIARDLSLVGPPARACGIRSDLRVILPYSAYARTPVDESVEKEGGDVLARFKVKDPLRG